MTDRIDLPLCLMKVGDAHLLGVGALSATGDTTPIEDEIFWSVDVKVAPDATVAPVQLTMSEGGKLCNLYAASTGEGYVYVHRTGEKPEAVARYLVHNYPQKYHVTLVAAGKATQPDNDPNVRDDDNDPLGEDRPRDEVKFMGLKELANTGASLTSVDKPTKPSQGAKQFSYISRLADGEDEHPQTPDSVPVSPETPDIEPAPADPHQEPEAQTPTPNGQPV